MKRTGARLLRILPAVGMAAILAAALTQVDDWSVEGLLSLAPGSLWAAAGLTLLFYAFKSLSFVFPVVVIQMAAGALFPLPAALAVNCGGLLVSSLLPYGVGHWSGQGAAEKLMDRYPRVRGVVERCRERKVLFPFLLRMVGVPPMDVASMMMGSMGMELKPYLLGSMLGFIPGMVAVTILGEHVTEPGSPAFVLSLAAWIAIMVCSLLVSRKVLGRKKHG